ncbi:hypothetical protein CYMTET_9799 [Cymbomonas tetramitiformis]|uniref:Uncharacterized protein n=1 Tax=Cymbomonas tetramitiformis TaxID=36881 RepID=A0AAE0GQR4_9CHLO|nr:hypothetical protein CYMTET_9799 [Cymbomonas tetramitiformis]
MKVESTTRIHDAAASELTDMEEARANAPGGDEPTTDFVEVAGILRKLYDFVEDEDGTLRMCLCQSRLVEIMDHYNTSTDLDGEAKVTRLIELIVSGYPAQAERVRALLYPDQVDGARADRRCVSHHALISELHDWIAGVYRAMREDTDLARLAWKTWIEQSPHYRQQQQRFERWCFDKKNGDRPDELTPEEAWEEQVAWVIDYVKQCPCPRTYTYLKKTLTKIKRRRNTLQGNETIARLVKKDNHNGHDKPLAQVAFESDVATGVPYILKRLRASATSAEERIGDVDEKWLPYLKKPWGVTLSQSTNTDDDGMKIEDEHDADAGTGETTTVDRARLSPDMKKALLELQDVCARVCSSQAYSRTARDARVATPSNHHNFSTTPYQSINAAIGTCGYKLTMKTERKRKQCNKHKTDRREICGARIDDQLRRDVLDMLHITCDACTRDRGYPSEGEWCGGVTYPYHEHASHHTDVHLDSLERELINDATGYAEDDLDETEGSRSSDASMEGSPTESVDVEALREWSASAQLELTTNRTERKDQLEIELKSVTALIKAAEDGGGRHYVHYHHSRKISEGRRYGTGPCIQRLRKAIRTRAARKYYHDIDIENCNPHIAWQMAKTDIGKTIPHLERYCKDRDGVLGDTMEFYKVNRDMAKRLYLVLMFGGSIDTWKRACDRQSRLPGDADGEFPHAQKFAEEMKALDAWVFMKVPALSASIHEWNERVSRTGQGKVINEAGRLAFAIQIEEDKIIRTIESRCRATGWKVGPLMFDGLMVERRRPLARWDQTLEDVPDATFPHTVLLDLQGYVKDTLGYEIRLLEKDMEICSESRFPAAHC